MTQPYAQRFGLGLLAVLGVLVTNLGAIHPVPFMSAGLALADANTLTAEEQVNVRIYKEAGPAVVNVASSALNYDYFLNPVPKQGSGSGIVISKDGYILTNYHVVEGAQQLEITLSDGKSFPAKFIGADPSSDIALLKVDPKGHPMSMLSLSNADDNLLVGQSVYAIGNPFGLNSTLTTGVISSLNRQIMAPNGRLIEHIIQTDAAINPGNSGGPLIDSSGTLIGINTAIFSPSGASAGIGFAVPANRAKKVVDDIMKYGRVIRPYLGVSSSLPVNANVAQALKLPVDYGLLICDIIPGSPAQTAGLHPGSHDILIGNHIFKLGGDIITSVDGKEVHSLEEMATYIESKKPGDTVKLEVLRDARSRVNLSVLLKEKPEIKN